METDRDRMIRLGQVAKSTNIAVSITPRHTVAAIGEFGAMYYVVCDVDWGQGNLY